MSNGSEIEDLSAIDLAANVAQRTAAAKPEQQRLADIEAQMAKMEPLLEQLQKNANMALALNDYVEDLRKEQVFFNKARWVLGIVAGIAILLISALLTASIFSPASPLLQSPPAAIAAFVLGLGSGIVFLINSFAKGIFRSTAERHADGFLPPALEKVHEAYVKIAGPAS